MDQEQILKQLTEWQKDGLLNNTYGTLDIRGRVVQSTVVARGGPLTELFEQAEEQGNDWFVVMFPGEKALLWMRKETLDHLAPYVETLGSVSAYPSQAKEAFWMALCWDHRQKEQVIVVPAEPKEQAKVYDWKKTEREGWVGWSFSRSDHLKGTVKFLKAFDLSKYRVAFAVEWGPTAVQR